MPVVHNLLPACKITRSKRRTEHCQMTVMKPYPRERGRECPTGLPHKPCHWSGQGARLHNHVMKTHIEHCTYDFEILIIMQQT